MNKQADLFYSGFSNENPFSGKINLLLQFQEKKREYLDHTKKQRRDETVNKSRQLLIEAKLSFSKDTSELEEMKNEGDYISELSTYPLDSKIESEDHLCRTIERMSFERPDSSENAETGINGKPKIAQRRGNSKKLTEGRRIGFLAKQLTIPEWMIAPPSNLNGDYWFVCAKPDGMRCFIISGDSKTIRRDKNGFLDLTFTSKLPNGGSDKESGKTCLLDCIFSTQLQTYFIMDVLIWKDVPISLNSTESRFFFIETNILADKELREISMENEYIFDTPKKHDCTIEGVTAVYTENTPYLKDGLLFSHKEAEYIPGSNPFFLIWKDMSTSLYAIETNGNEAPSDEVQCVLELNDDNRFQTLDGIVLSSMYEQRDFEISSKPGNLFRVSIGDISINEKEEDISNAFQFKNVRVLKKSSYKRATADNISKIIFQYLIRTAPVKMEDILAAIKLTQEREMKNQSQEKIV